MEFKVDLGSSLDSRIENAETFLVDSGISRELLAELRRLTFISLDEVRDSSLEEFPGVSWGDINAGTLAESVTRSFVGSQGGYSADVVAAMEEVAKCFAAQRIEFEGDVEEW